MDEICVWADVVKRQLVDLGHGLSRLAVDASLETADAAPVTHAVSMADLLQSVRIRWADAALKKGLNLNLDACGAHVRSNRDLLRSIVDNLVGNAVAHTSSGSVAVHCVVEATTLLLCVRDTGCGISNDDLQRIFDPFWQRHGNAAGMGVGLAIVKRAAVLLGHEIVVDSLLGAGSAFTLRIPLMQAPSPITASAHESNA